MTKCLKASLFVGNSPFVVCHTEIGSYWHSLCPSAKLLYADSLSRTLCTWSVPALAQLLPGVSLVEVKPHRQRRLSIRRVRHQLGQFMRSCTWQSQASFDPKCQRNCMKGLAKIFHNAITHQYTPISAGRYSTLYPVTALFSVRQVHVRQIESMRMKTGDMCSLPKLLHHILSTYFLIYL